MEAEEPRTDPVLSRLSAARAPRPGRRVRTIVHPLSDGSGTDRPRPDELATEEPLEIRLNAGGRTERVAVTMRTPGDDFELAAGFLLTEGIIGAPEEIHRIRYCSDPGMEDEQRYNVVTADIRGELPELRHLERHFTMSSACGVCGKTSIDALAVRGCASPPRGPEVSAEVLFALPERLRAAQGVFDRTGGLHATGLFDRFGELVCAREDVGRHNAVDKAIGWALTQGRVPLHEHVLLVSGRSSFEIMQKALVAGIPIVCAVSAPSSLAVTLAKDFGMTLVGFLRGTRGNVYAGAERIAGVGPGAD